MMNADQGVVMSSYDCTSSSCSGQLSAFNGEATSYIETDCARTVHESLMFALLGLASSERQIPQSVENIRNQKKGWG
jgi:hypothetical protein